MLRRLLYVGYRCRSCHRRFARLSSAPLVGAAVTLLFIFAIGFGWGFRSAYHESIEQAAPAADAAPAEADPFGLPVKPKSTAGDATIKLADRGDAKAQFELGMAYRTGQTGPRDPGLAYQWLEKSAQQGYADAQYVLGAMHLAGEGVLQNFPAAFDWFEQAARQNHAEAQFHLGRMYRRGYGVAVDNTKAYVWFNLAAAQGHERAREARDNLLPLLNPEQIKAAQRDAKEWRPAAASP